jgi:CBS domain-containing protein
MAAVRDILARKGNEVVTLPGTATVLEAAQLMSERGIGAVLITQGDTPAGIFTERDVLRRVVAEQRDPATTTLQAVMSSPITACSPETSLEECVAVMTARRMRHLPVMGAEGLCGVLSSRDVLAFHAAEQQATIAQLHSYVFDLR